MIFIQKGAKLGAKYVASGKLNSIATMRIHIIAPVIFLKKLANNNPIDDPIKLQAMVSRINQK